ncbi:hypothetical protein Tsubulata_051129 [Turnera subulata]|uniref:BI1-like protein n=1 Tax=Turnera subulata TaxID=218843 RepID=A0A9Q0JKQ8_9ROSI|nr:hypothetical protein Tsubulata_051129 [Turnera subulata]
MWAQPYRKTTTDLEASGARPLYPMMLESPQLRWAFIRKVYSIISLQLLLTIAVAAVVVANHQVAVFFATTGAGLALYILLILMPFLGKIILESAILTATVVLSLTLYTFWAARRGHDFNFLGPFLFGAVLVLMVFALIQILFPLGKISLMVYGLLASIIFSGYIIYDTDNLIKRFSYDEYIWAAELPAGLVLTMCFREKDMEAGDFPTVIDDTENRWIFIRKVYFILTIQLVITVAVAAAVVLHTSIADFIVNTKVILESAILTLVAFVSLTLYTFWAASRGHDFSFLGPFLAVSLIALLLFGLIQIFFPLGKISVIYGCLGTIIFCGYIIYDTDNLIKRFAHDEYIWAAVSLYLDITNLFLCILNICGECES